MPPISLVVCVHNQRDLLARLLSHAVECYDDLVVVHDGAEGEIDTPTRNPEVQAPLNYFELPPDASLPPGYHEPKAPPRPGSIHELVRDHGGTYYEGPRAFQQEPHWPFAWWRARHDWILRWDADEFPGSELRGWLQEFRQSPEPAVPVSGYTCIWPLWNGNRAVSRHWPAGRSFLFHKGRVRFFGMVEAVPVGDFPFTPVLLALRHEPRRKSYGLANLIFRRQAYHWRWVIAWSLLRPISSLQNWRWETNAWPPTWEQIRQHPFRTGLYRLIFGTARTLRDQWRVERRIFPIAAVSGPLHHALIGLEFWRLRRQQEHQHGTARVLGAN